MRYEPVCKGRFISRPNRFIAQVEVDGKMETCHVKNTGRCRELLLPGAEVVLQRFDPAITRRKTSLDLIAVWKGEKLINMDAQAPNQVFQEWAESGAFLSGISQLRPEVRYGGSRLDFSFEAEGRRCLAEIKGVTLEEKGAVYFPDAPTQRGARHLEELMRAVSEGIRAFAVFVVQMEGADYFSPHDATDPEFGQTLRRAAENGVEIIAVDCLVAPDSLSVHQKVEVRL